MAFPLIRKVQLFETSMYQVKRIIKIMCASPGIKMIYADKPFEFFHIEMCLNNKSRLLYCSFLSKTKATTLGVIEGYNINEEALTIDQITEVFNAFVNEFNNLVNKQIEISKDNLHKLQIKQPFEINHSNPTKTKKENIPASKIVIRHPIITNKNYKASTSSNDAKKWLILILIIIIIVALSISKDGKIVHVNGYYRSNGTHVKSYDRKP